MSTNDYFIFSVFIFPRQKMNQYLMINAPAENEDVAQPKD